MDYIAIIKNEAYRSKLRAYFTRYTFIRVFFVVLIGLFVFLALTSHVFAETYYPDGTTPNKHTPVGVGNNITTGLITPYYDKASVQFTYLGSDSYKPTKVTTQLCTKSDTIGGTATLQYTIYNWVNNTAPEAGTIVADTGAVAGVAVSGSTGCATSPLVNMSFNYNFGNLIKNSKYWIVFTRIYYSSGNGKSIGSVQADIPYTRYTGPHDLGSGLWNIVYGSTYQQSWWLYLTTEASYGVTFTTPSAPYSSAVKDIDVAGSFTVGTAGCYSVYYTYHLQPSDTANLFGNTNVNVINLCYPVGSWVWNTKLTASTAGTYTFINATLKDQYGNILAQSPNLNVTVTILASGFTAGFSEGNYYSGSSTSYYLGLLPSIFTNNGVTSTTVLYSSIATLIDKALNWVFGVVTPFNQYFSQSNATYWGHQVNSGIITLWGFIKNFDSFTNGYPFVATFLVFLFLELAIIVIKAIRVIFFR